MNPLEDRSHEQEFQPKHESQPNGENAIHKRAVDQQINVKELGAGNGNGDEKRKHQEQKYPCQARNHLKTCCQNCGAFKRGQEILQNLKDHKPQKRPHRPDKCPADLLLLCQCGATRISIHGSNEADDVPCRCCPQISTPPHRFPKEWGIGEDVNSQHGNHQQRSHKLQPARDKFSIGKKH